MKASKHIIQQDLLPENISYVAGVDVSYKNKLSIGVAAVLNYDTLSLVESKIAHVKIKLPYIPTLLSFREIPPVVAAIKKLHLQPDAFLVDGHGIMHPYRLGFASHLGLVLRKPTIGVAKRPLIGNVGYFNKESWAPITDKGEVIGLALIIKKRANPLYISIGHQISLKRAMEIVRHCTPTHRIPKPIRLAHHLGAQERRKVQNSN